MPGIPFEKNDPRINRDGRPVGARSFTTKVREALEKIAEGKEYTYEEALVKTVMHKAIVDKDPAMIRLVWNYLDGLPTGSLDLSGELITHVITRGVNSPISTSSEAGGDSPKQ